MTSLDQMRRELQDKFERLKGWNPSAVATPEEEVGQAKRRAREFADYLRLRDFSTRIVDYPSGATVDFYDPDLRRKIEMIATRYNHEGAVDYSIVQTRGSIQFRDMEIEGKIPISMIRPEVPLESFVRQMIVEEKPAEITEVHLHIWDHKPAVHIRVKGEYVDPFRLATFVSNIRNISWRFLDVFLKK